MKIIAHRGASGHAPENTLAAFSQALDMGADAIEVDVFNVEGHLVVIHDRWTSRTTDGELRIDKIGYQELRKLNAGEHQQVPTLWEVMKLVDGRCDLNIELKGPETLALTLNLIDIATEQLAFRDDQFLLSSFNHHWLQQAKVLMPSLSTGALTASCPVDYAAFAEELEAYSVHIDIDAITPEFIKDAHKRDLRVLVYTVNEKEDMQDMLSMGVDGIFTNYPQRAKSLLT